MVKVVTDPGQTDPEAEDNHSKLEKRTDNFHGSDKSSETNIVDPGEVIETSLKVDDEKHATVETEAGVTRQERQSCFMKPINN